LIEKCSGGQKARIILCGLSIQNLDVIVMDEPTNHLDIESVDALISLLKEFKGAIIIISHDMYLLNEIDCNLFH
jgi:ATP-binding cassette subfamily F protein 3